MEQSDPKVIGQRSWYIYTKKKNTKPAFDVVVPSSAHQQNAIWMAFPWWVDDGPLLMVFGSSLPSPTKNIVRVDLDSLW